MRFVSTRNNKLKENSFSAVTRGLAPDGGLLLPQKIRPFTDAQLQRIFCAEKYQDVCGIVMHALSGDFTEGELRGFGRLAYASFDSLNPAPIRRVEGDLFALELWHGPTGAFKDMALQMLPSMLPRAKQAVSDESLSLAVTATSGDTGGAAMCGFSDVSGTAVFTAFPLEGVSPIQKRQMCSCLGDNVYAIAIKGNFDDAQRGVKALFADEEVAETLSALGISLTTANSINWARLSAQVPYYFWAYSQLLKQKAITMGEEITFSVPTGNFGDILAGLYAKRLGLPVKRLICATNSNDVLCGFINNGVYDADRSLVKTCAPSMDIIVSSNVERLLSLEGDGCAQTAALMRALEIEKKYVIPEKLHKNISAVFSAQAADDRIIQDTINRSWRSFHYLCDPHTAAALYAAQNGSTLGKTVIVSTATPYKFPLPVLSALTRVSGKPDEFRAVRKLNELTHVEVPYCVSQLEKAQLRFNDVYSPKGIKSAVLSFAARLRRG